MKLTEKKLLSLKAKKKPYRVADGNGLYILVRPSGNMSWQYRYHIYEQGKRLEKIDTIQGGYPTISLKGARAEHRSLRERVLKGEDITLTKKTERKKLKEVKSETLNDIAEEWLEVRKTQVNNTESWNREWSSLSRHILVKFGDKKIYDITPADIFEQAQKVASTHSIDIAKRTVRYVGYVYDYAIPLRKATINIANGLTKLLGKHSIENRKAILDTDLLGKWVYTVENNSDSKDVIGCYLRMIAHLGVRGGELAQMKWSEIDLKKQEWNFDIGKTKDYGVKDFRVFLTDQVIKILEDVKRITHDKEYVFHGVGKKGYITSRAVQYRMDDLGFSNDIVTPHGFRQTILTLGIDECKEQFEVIDLCLAHLPVGIHKRTYNKATRWDERVQFYKNWSDFLIKLKQNHQKSTIKSVK
ncbi:MAG: integrase arm-type DNA-binding domain-containing protein [Pelagibacterales bacterium]|nr:integrase arm-type DNA-binding domain-containing protein [Pelagibacterales bacterium]